MGIGRNIAIKRKLLHMTQSELARKAGISRGYLSQIEAGVVVPHRKTLARIAYFLEAKRGEKLERGD